MNKNHGRDMQPICATISSCLSNFSNSFVSSFTSNNFSAVSISLLILYITQDNYTIEEVLLYNNKVQNQTNPTIKTSPGFVINICNICICNKICNKKIAL